MRVVCFMFLLSELVHEVLAGFFFFCGCFECVVYDVVYGFFCFVCLCECVVEPWVCVFLAFPPVVAHGWRGSPFGSISIVNYELKGIA